MADIARLAGVRRPAVSNWRRRHPDFPTAAGRSPHEMFDAGEVAGWLDRRPISAAARTPDEPPGTTFGDRFRRAFSSLDPVREDAPGERATASRPEAAAGDPVSGGDDAARRVVAPLANWLAGLRGLGDTAPYTDTLLLLLYLCICDVKSWSWLVNEVTGRPGRPFSESLPQAVARHVREHPQRSWIRDGFSWSWIQEHSHGTFFDLVVRISTLNDAGALAPFGAPADDAKFKAKVFADLVGRITAREGNRRGEFHTPRSVTDLVARIAAVDGSHRLYDPCCGTGELLVAAARPGMREGQVQGDALSARAALATGLRLAIHGLPTRLSAGAIQELRRPTHGEGAFDRIVSNPPFRMSPWTELAPGDRRWTHGTPPEGSATFAWLQHAAWLLAPGGRAVVVMPPTSVYSSHRAERDIRRRMVQDGLVRCVIELPRGLFDATETAVTVWVLEKPPRKGPRPNGDLLLVDASSAPEREFGGIADVYDAWSASESLPETGVLARGFSPDELEKMLYVLSPRGLLKPRAGWRDKREAGERVQRSADLIRRLTEDAEWIDTPTNWFLSGGVPGTGPQGEMVRLEEVCTVQMGPSGSIPLTGDRSGVPIVTPAQIRDRRLHDTGLEYAALDYAEDHPQYLLEPGDVVCVRTGLISRTAIVGEQQADRLLGRGCLLLRPGPGILPSYLLHYLNHPRVVEWVLRSATAAVLPTISIRRLRDLPVSLPSLPRQDEIVAPLDALDDQIAAHTALVRAAREAHGHMLEALLPEV
ncbi:N-6 DNA methylase [Actinomadura roseirufa]|uniref:N-6 DNA methylase n=1 Tax=Actinomadura roseirufa TaxID=2094049 RepID=UPI0010419A92|nr:N-6 DNA methylase [Actinomadura roseirufa]